MNLKDQEAELNRLRSEIFVNMMRFMRDEEYNKDGPEIVASFMVINMMAEIYHDMLYDLGCDPFTIEEVRKRSALMGQERVYNSKNKAFINKDGKA